MKKLVIIASILMFNYSFTFSQEKRMCNAEALANKPDVMIQKDYVNIGKAFNLTISVETVQDVTNKQKLTALDMEFSYYENGSTINKAVLLDPDETDALIVYLQALQDNVINLAKPTQDTEFSFVSKSGFECGCYWNNGWGVYIKVDTHNQHTNVDLSKEDFGAFQSFVKQAKAKM